MNDEDAFEAAVNIAISQINGHIRALELICGLLLGRSLLNHPAVGVDIDDALMIALEALDALAETYTHGTDAQRNNFESIDVTKSEVERFARAVLENGRAAGPSPS